METRKEKWDKMNIILMGAWTERTGGGMPVRHPPTLDLTSDAVRRPLPGEVPILRLWSNSCDCSPAPPSALRHPLWLVYLLSFSVWPLSWNQRFLLRCEALVSLLLCGSTYISACFGVSVSLSFDATSEAICLMLSFWSLLFYSSRPFERIINTVYIPMSVMSISLATLRSMESLILFCDVHSPMSS